MLRYLRPLGLYYQSVAPFTLGVSGLILAAPLLLDNPFPGPLGVGLGQQLASVPVLIYLIGQFRPQQYWLYRNLHLAPWQLWTGVTLLNLVVLTVAHQFLAVFTRSFH